MEIPVAIPYPWYEFYKAALLETDGRKIQHRIQAAEAKLQDRLRNLSEDHGGTPAERRAIAAAIGGLKVLLRESADWPERPVSDDGTGTAD